MSLFSLLNPLSIITLVAQLVTIIHAVKTGRTSPWLYIILFLPGIGCLAYLIVEILPTLSLSSGFAGIAQLFDNPKSRIAKLEKELAFNTTVAHKVALADAYREVSEYQKAADMYMSCLEGIYKTDEGIQLKLAETYFAMEQYEKAKEILESLKKQRQGKFIPPELLLYAKCAEALGKFVEAESLYREAAMAYPGLEGNYRYCEFLRKQGKEDDVEQQVILARRKFDGMYPKFRRVEGEWMKKIDAITS